MTEKLSQNSPYLDEVEWEDSFYADEDPDPLFDSTRNYVDQIACYKRHQDKPTEAKISHRPANCVICGNPFNAVRSDHVYCSDACQRRQFQLNRAQRRMASRPAKPCAKCGAEFMPPRQTSRLCAACRRSQ